jgi:lipoate-protein ligase B
MKDSTTSNLLEIRDFGLADYEAIRAEQQALAQRRASREVPDMVLLGEHPPVITLGRGTRPENLRNPTIPMVEVERGGDVTYHGPGQLVAYPIIHLPPGRRDLHRHLRNLEEVIMDTLRAFGLEGVRNPGKTGVWLADSSDRLLKVASIGVAVRRWVTYHGLALNVAPDLTHFTQINPCGLPSDTMTAMSRFLPDTPDMQDVKNILAQSFQQAFRASFS